MTDFKERMMEMHRQRMREEYENRMRGNRLDEMSQYKPEITGLPVSVWIDDDGRILQHGPRIKFDPMNGTSKSSGYPAMPVCDNPKVRPDHMKNVRTKTDDMRAVESFAQKAHRYKVKHKKPHLLNADFKELFKMNLAGTLDSHLAS